MGKKIVLLSTWCNTEEKSNALLSMLKKLKGMGLDTMVFTPFYISDEIDKYSDYTIISKENPIPEINKKYIYSWMTLPSGLELGTTTIDHGFASLLQMKRLLDFGISLDYDHYFVMIYDLGLTPELEIVLLEGRECSFFTNSNVPGEHVVCTLMAFDKNNASKFASLITPRSYFHSSSYTAETWLLEVKKILGGTIEPWPANDTIHSASDTLSKNHSKFPEFAMFIIKSNMLELFFYDIQKEFKVYIETNIAAFTEIVYREKRVVVFNNIQDFERCKITVNETSQDITNTIKMLNSTSLTQK